MAKKNTQLPDISDAELKMPEDSLGASNTADERPKRHIVGPILAILIVVLILILAGLYLWGTTLQNEGTPSVNDAAARPSAAENNEPESNNAEADVQALRTVSNSDELSAIEADLEATNLDSIDAELNAIEAELASDAE